MSDVSISQPPIRLSFVRATAFAAAALAVLAIGLYLGATRLGEALRIAGASTDPKPIAVVVGRQRFEIPANAIRFAEQRTAQPQGELDLYLAWPSLSGFTQEKSGVFHDPEARNLIFLRLMASDGGEPGERASDPPSIGSAPAGLTRSLREGLPSIASQEAVYRGAPSREPPYEAACLDGKDAVMAADCIREIKIAPGLRLRYRFSHALLPQWDAIDHAVLRFAVERRRS